MQSQGMQGTLKQRTGDTGNQQCRYRFLNYDAASIYGFFCITQHIYVFRMIVAINVLVYFRTQH